MRLANPDNRDLERARQRSEIERERSGGGLAGFDFKCGVVVLRQQIELWRVEERVEVGERERVKQGRERRVRSPSENYTPMSGGGSGGQVEGEGNKGMARKVVRGFAQREGAIDYYSFS